MLAVNSSTVKRWADSGKLRCFKTPGGHRRFTADRILAFIENFKYNAGSPQSGTAQRLEITLGHAIDFLVAKKDYHLLQEVCFADALQGDHESFKRLLVKCRLEANIPLTVIYDEIVSKTINEIKHLGQEGKLDPEQQEEVIKTILEAFVGLRDLP